jgi:multidrug efflux system membrane fusion protein
VWIIVLLVFAGGFYLVLRKRDASASAAKAPRGGGGPVTLVTATATKGDIGVYLDSIGTVTPVYTASITSQVNGIVTAVHYKEGQLVHKGDPLIDIDPRPYLASLLQAQGTLEHDTNLLAQSKMDFERYTDAWARKAIPETNSRRSGKTRPAAAGHHKTRSRRGSVRSDSGRLLSYRLAH